MSDFKFDYLVVGAGPYGCTFARTVRDAGKSVLVIDRRKHIAGNAYDERVEGINVHRYGAHIFHTNDAGTWKFMNRFGAFNGYQHRVRAFYRGQVLPVPFDMNLMHRLWGVVTVDEAKAFIERSRGADRDPRENLEQWVLSQVGREIYETIVKGYTEKQWGRPCRDLPASIIQRLPIRYAYDDRYFTDTYQGVPADGYTALFGRMIEDVAVGLGEDYLARRYHWNDQARRVIYTGPIDEFYDYSYGELEYRSLRFDTQLVAEGATGCAVMNFTDKLVPFTRVMDWKHFAVHENQPAHSVVTTEYPQTWKRGMEAYYPVRDRANVDRYDLYRALTLGQTKFHFGGRLGTYAYYDMHQVVAQARSDAGKLLSQEIEA